MEKKKLNSKEIASIKRVAQNVDADLMWYNKLQEEIKEKQEKMQEIKERIELHEAPVRKTTGGYVSSDIIKKVIIDVTNDDGTPKLDKKTGKQVRTTKYVLRYPDTIYPPEETEEKACDEVPVPAAGNDLDEDKESWTPLTEDDL